MLNHILEAWARIAVLVPTALLTVSLLFAILRRNRRPSTRTDGPLVHIVRPICGREPDADRKNASLLRQTYSTMALSFVATSESDLGFLDARRVCKGEARAECLVAKDDDASSGKGRNMIRGWRASSAPLIGFCDSDIELAQGDVGACVDALLETNAAAAFAPCLYDPRGFWGRVVMQLATVDKYSLAEAGAWMGVVPCMEGGFMVISRPALEAAGGIEVVAGALADDLRIARVLRQRGEHLAVSRAPIRHQTPAESARVWAVRYLRWAVCRRGEAPLLQILTLLLHPIVVPAVAALVCTDSRIVSWLVAGALWRIANNYATGALLLAPHGIRLGGWVFVRPLAEILDAAFIVSAMFVRSLDWRGTNYRIDWRGQIARVEYPRRAVAISVRCPP